jgi:hypothetical protein
LSGKNQGGENAQWNFADDLERGLQSACRPPLPRHPNVFRAPFSQSVVCILAINSSDESFFPQRFTRQNLLPSREGIARARC